MENLGTGSRINGVSVLEALEHVDTHSLEQELKIRYRKRTLLQAVKEIEKATGKQVIVASQIDLDDSIEIKLELK